MPEAGAEWLFAYADTILEPDAKLHEEFQGKAVDPEELGPGIFRVDPGDYFFSQWDTEDFKEPITGLRAFAEAVEDESKNKGRRTKGPWMLRVLHKEGGTRFQGFKRISV
ncbi:MAG: hypothetical protein NT061_04480 [Spirochaetes bacterium]|nr:hypothetical protein [Spirochaetota bacterium]